MTPEEELLDYRRTVAGMYARIRAGDLPPAEASARFRRERDALFKGHPQSALSMDDRAHFTGLGYFPYDPACRLVLPVEPIDDPTVIEVQLEHDGLLRMRRFGQVHFVVGGQPAALTLFWIMGYGGGVFLPFRDQTSGHETYGGGRYLLDTIKHADLGHEGTRLVLDFNYAYNPSCAYDPRWFCPLAPVENRLPVPIRAGELTYAPGA